MVPARLRRTASFGVSSDYEGEDGLDEGRLVAAPAVEPGGGR
jgi:hypothetical protein